MGLNKLIQEKRREILEIAARHGAYNVRLFGSVARGEADEASDVDILKVLVAQAFSLCFTGRRPVPLRFRHRKYSS